MKGSWAVCIFWTVTNYNHTTGCLLIHSPLPHFENKSDCSWVPDKHSQKWGGFPPPKKKIQCNTWAAQFSCSHLLLPSSLPQTRSSLLREKMKNQVAVDSHNCDSGLWFPKWNLNSSLTILGCTGRFKVQALSKQGYEWAFFFFWGGACISSYSSLEYLPHSNSSTLPYPGQDSITNSHTHAIFKAVNKN